MELPDDLHGERYCRLATQGRMTARRHSAELWFVPCPGGVYLMSGSGGLTTWCLNLQTEQQGVVRIGDRAWLARASVIDLDDPDREEALRAFHDRYDPPDKDRTASWLRDATVLQLAFVRELTPL